MRLAGGSGENEGRVEVCLGGEWGAICDRGWGVNDATVICRQLGLVNSTTGKPFRRIARAPPSFFPQMEYPLILVEKCGIL